MYPRLFLARNLLRDDGVIFVSIDDHEVYNLRVLMNEIFGEENFLAHFSWKTDGNFDNQAKFKKCHEYILVYAKNESDFPHPPVVDPCVSPSSKLFRDEVRNTIIKNGSKNPVSEIVLPIGFPCDFSNGLIKKREHGWPLYLMDAQVENNMLSNSVIVKSGWSSKELLESFIENNCKPVFDSKQQETTFIISKSGAIEVIKKREFRSHVITSLGGLGGTQRATLQIEDLGIVFDDYPKPIELIKYLIKMNQGNDFTVLDFFAGSCTSAHSTLSLNNEDGGSRRFIMVQLPEPCKNDSKALVEGYETIADIGKERIRRVIKKIIEGENGKLDLNSLGQQDRGFKVFKLTESNFKIWDGTAPQNVEQLSVLLQEFAENIRSDTTKLGMLYEILLKAGFPLTAKVEKLEIAGQEIYAIEDRELFICLEYEILEDTVRQILTYQPKPKQFISLDSSFRGNDQLKTNTQLQMRDHDIKFRTV
jgi:adenine-specific DNA-methyltransferase